MAEIVLGILAEHLAFMTTNGAFNNNFGPWSRRRVDVGWSHRFKLRASRAGCNMNRRVMTSFSKELAVAANNHLSNERNRQKIAGPPTSIIP
jgi:hypothetical protein